MRKPEWYYEWEVRRWPSRVIGWLRRRLVSLVSLGLMAWLIWLLWQHPVEKNPAVSPASAGADSTATGGSPPPALTNQERLVIVLAILGLAVVVQSGASFLGRLRKVGPIEFIDVQTEKFIPELEDAPFYDDITEAGPLPEKIAHQAEKVHQFLNSLDFHEADGSPLLKDPELHDLYLKAASAAFWQQKWRLVIDHTERLLEISEGKFKPGRVHYRCGYAHLELARREGIDKERQLLLFAALDHLVQATKASPGGLESFSYFYNLGNAQFHLGRWKAAKESFRRALELKADFAKARWNLAAALAQSRELDSARDELKKIPPADPSWAGIKTDIDLKPLRDDPVRWPQVVAHFEPRSV